MPSEVAKLVIISFKKAALFQLYACGSWSTKMQYNAICDTQNLRLMIYRILANFSKIIDQLRFNIVKTRKHPQHGKTKIFNHDISIINALLTSSS